MGLPENYFVCDGSLRSRKQSLSYGEMCLTENYFVCDGSLRSSQQSLSYGKMDLPELSQY